MTTCATIIAWGSFALRFAPVSAGNPLLVQLDLNLNGMLKVSAREKATGLQKTDDHRERPGPLRARRTRRGAANGWTN